MGSILAMLFLGVSYFIISLVPEWIEKGNIYDAVMGSYVSIFILFIVFSILNTEFYLSLKKRK